MKLTKEERERGINLIISMKRWATSRWPAPLLKESDKKLLALLLVELKSEGKQV